MKTEYDIVIIGAGPAGLSAAIAAAESGQSILILDNNPQAGGQIWRAGPVFPVPETARQKYRQIQASPHIECLFGAKIVAAPFAGQLLVERTNDSLNLSYRQLIICSGARELFLPFPGWTLPGVTGAGGLQALIKAGTPVANERIVIAGSGPLLLASADTAQKAGAQVLRVAEQASHSAVYRFAFQLWRWPAKIMQTLSLPYRLYQPDSYVIGAFGQERLEGVRLQTAKGVIEVECDRLACGFGLVPNIQLGQLMGCQIKDNAIMVDQYQRSSQPHIFAAGECTGFGGSELAMVEGEIAGYAAIAAYEKARQLFAQRQRYQIFARLLAQSFRLRHELKTLARPETVFCRCEDVTFDQVAGRENWVDAKLHTRCGMGACQGSTCATAAACLYGWQLPDARPPLLPTRVKSLMSMSVTSLKQK